MSAYERTHWRDEKLSQRHRNRWGFDCPMTDIDFLVVEYDEAEPKALVEYKHIENKQVDLSDANYRALTKLADLAKLPFYNVRYGADLKHYLVSPVNEVAQSFLSASQLMTERQYVEFLYLLRGRVLPPRLAAILYPKEVSR